MTGMVKHLMENSGCNFVYGYTESDEISLLFSLESHDFGRKLRKLNSILEGEASAKFSLLYGDIAVFDCRIRQLPNKSDVVDYFRWRNEDACRNALNAWCYWTLRKEGQSKKDASTAIEGLSVSGKNELLFQHGINFNDLPLWQKRGIGFYWEKCDKDGSERRRLKIDQELPLGDAYGEFILGMLE